MTQFFHARPSARIAARINFPSPRFDRGLDKKLPGDNAANDAGLLFVKLKNGGGPVMFEERGQYGTPPGIRRCIFFPFFLLFRFCFYFYFFLSVPSSSFFVWQLYSFTVRLLSGKLDFYLNCSRKQILMSLILFKRK